MFTIMGLMVATQFGSILMLFVFFNFASTPGASRTCFTFASCIRVLHPHAVLHPRRRWQRPDGLPCLSYQPLCSMPPQMAVWVPPIPPDWRPADCSLYPADPSIVKPGHIVVLSVLFFACTQRCKRASAFCIHPPFCIHRFVWCAQCLPCTQCVENVRFGHSRFACTHHFASPRRETRPERSRRCQTVHPPFASSRRFASPQTSVT